MIRDVSGARGIYSLGTFYSYLMNKTHLMNDPFHKVFNNHVGFMGFTWTFPLVR